MITAIGVTGIPELDAAFGAMRLTIDKAKIEGAKEGGKTFQEEWKKNIQNQGWASGHAPVDKRNVPPHGYDDSIQVGDPVLAPGAVFIEIFTDLEPRSDQPHEYPYYQEYGWVSRSGNVIPARPTMTPAYDSKKDEAEAKIVAIIQTSVIARFPARWAGQIRKFMTFSAVKSGSGIALQ